MENPLVDAVPVFCKPIPVKFPPTRMFPSFSKPKTAPKVSVPTAVGIEPAQTIDPHTAKRSEEKRSSDHDSIIFLERDRVDGVGNVCLWIKGGIQSPIRIQASYIVSRDSVDIG